MIARTWLAAGSGAVREWKRFYRQRSRILASLITPLVFWLFLGAGLNTAFTAPGTPAGGGFTEVFYPGVLVLTVLFSSIFSSISLIEDRNQGFLQGVLAAPVSRGAVVAGKVAGGAGIALAQGLIFLLLAPLAGFSPEPLGWAVCVAALGATAFALASLGFAFAWRLDSVQGFHAVMNVVLFPMWLLSGAFFPVHAAPMWLRPLMWANPLTYAVLSVRDGLYWGQASVEGSLGGLSLAVLVAFAGLLYAAAVAVVGKGRGVALR